MKERKLAIGSTMLLFLASVAILTYQQGVISDLTTKVNNLKVQAHASGKGPISFSERTVDATPGIYELNVIKAAMAVPDFGSMIPPELSRGLKWTLRDRNRLHFIGGNLVILEVQDPTGQVLPLLFQIPDPSQIPTWRYLYGFVSS